MTQQLTKVETQNNFKRKMGQQLNAMDFMEVNDLKNKIIIQEQEFKDSQAVSDI
jgi:hypothetical protein